MYLTILIFFFFNMVCFDWLKYDRNKNIMYYLEMMILVLVAGCRYKVGGDTFLYMSFLESAPTLQNITPTFFKLSEFNFLWDLLICLCKTICSDFTFFQFVHAVFVNLVFFWFFKKYTPYIFSAVFCYTVGHFLYFNTEILREVLCICIFMLATPALLKKNYLKYYILCLIALGFHNSAIIMFIAPLVMFFKKINLKSTIILALFIIVFSSAFLGLASYIIGFLDNDILSTKFSFYTNSYYNIVGILYQLFLCLPVGIMIFLNQKNNDKNDFNNLICLLFLLYILSLTFYDIAMRLCNYLLPFYIVFGLNVFMKFFHDIKKSVIIKPIIFLAVFCVFFNFGYFYFYKPDIKCTKPFYNRYFPYTSIFSENNTHDITRKRFFFVRDLHNHTQNKKS